MPINPKVRKLLVDPLLRRDLSIVVDDFELEVESGPISLGTRITLEEGDYRFRLELRDPQGRDLMKLFPWRSPMSATEFFNGRGTIGNELEVRLVGVQPPCQSTTKPIGVVRASTAVTHFARIELPPDGSDLLTFDEFSERYGGPSKGPETSPEPEEGEFYRKEWDHSHLALFADTKAIFRNASRTRELEHPYWGRTRGSDMVSWDGDLFDGRFSLLDEGGHLLVGFHFPTREGDDPEQQANALYAAVGYVHAINPWPGYVCIRKRGRLVDHHLRSTRPIQGKWKPLSGRQRIQDEETPTRLIEAVATWLYSLGDREREDISTALWAFRSADQPGIPAPVKLATLGAVIERLFTSRAPSPPPDAFLSFRSEVIEWARTIERDAAGTEREGFAKRLAGYLNSWGYHDRRTTWLEAFGPLFPGRLEWLGEIYRLYQKHRHAPAHGDFAATMAHDGSDLIHAIGRLSGFVNLVIAANAGYKGPILESTSADTVIHLR
jgi:hypothetical protein